MRTLFDAPVRVCAAGRIKIHGPAHCPTEMTLYKKNKGRGEYSALRQTSDLTLARHEGSWPGLSFSDLHSISRLARPCRRSYKLAH